MLKLGDLGQQHVIHRRLADLVGQDAVDEFERAWLDHHMTKADMDALGRWGFNSVRLPMHHALFLDPAAPAGTDRWNEDGFRRVDRLLDWAAANRMWVILDLHAAPGGQGTDLAISDRDPNQPSLWDSAENQRRTVALWREIARRYAGNPWVGGYDILNEPNWDFDGPGGGHGCNDKNNRPIAALYKAHHGRDPRARPQPFDRHRGQLLGQQLRRDHARLGRQAGPRASTNIGTGTTPPRSPGSSNCARRPGGRSGSAKAARIRTAGSATPSGSPRPTTSAGRGGRSRSSASTTRSKSCPTRDGSGSSTG